jgi:hypothetical protein
MVIVQKASHYYYLYMDRFRSQARGPSQTCIVRAGFAGSSTSDSWQCEPSRGTFARETIIIDSMHHSTARSLAPLNHPTPFSCKHSTTVGPGQYIKTRSVRLFVPGRALLT